MLLPLELRSRIYELLFPGLFVPANKLGNVIFERMSTTILGVNRQIHDEAAYVLYGKKTFETKVARYNLTMCNSVQKGQCQVCHPFEPITPRSAHARGPPLQPYDMQRMLREQQSRQRMITAREARGGMETQPTCTCKHGLDYNDYYDNVVNSALKSPIPYTLEAYGPSWIPSLSMRYFEMIRSFHIALEVPNGVGLPFARFGAQYGRIDARGANPEEYEMIIYQYCDHVYRLVGRLRQSPRKNLHLGVDIDFRREYNATAHVNLLLKPFKLLEGSAQVEVAKITSSCPITPAQDLSASICQYVQNEGARKAFDEFWRLEEIMIRIDRELPRVVIFQQLRDHLHAARVARACDDLSQLSKVFNTVVGLWSEYARKQMSFLETIDQEIEDICAKVLI
jgi:hypothetical protein